MFLLSLPSDNYALLCHRSDIGVKKEAVDGPNSDRGDTPVTSSIMCPVLNVVGAWSPHVEESVDLNTKLNPLESTWFKVRFCLCWHLIHLFQNHFNALEQSFLQGIYITAKFHQACSVQNCELIYVASYFVICEKLIVFENCCCKICQLF